ncbi:MAG: hypothetical protein OEY49_17115, partial [Candidatus Heimdallarchaeota archaeon]|nr:hypothetical protein [Candidatus Heimdallarchaeota archaeon]
MQRLNHLFLILLFLGSTITIKIQYDATPEVQFDFKAYASDFNLDDKPDLVNLCVDFRFKKEGYYSFNLQFQIASLSQNMNIPHLQYNQKIWIQSEYPKYKTTKCIFWKSDLEGDLKIHLFIFQENQLVDEKVVYLSNFGTSDFSFIYDLFSYDSDFDLLNDSMYLKIGLSEDVNVIQDYNFLIDINITINNERRILDTQQINLNSHNHLTYIMALPTTPKQSQMNTSLQIKNTYNEPLTVKKTFNWINNQSQPRSIFSIVNQSHNTIYPSLEFYFTLNKNIPVESFSLQINLTIILKDHILNFTYNKSYFYNPEDIYSYYNYWNSPENTSLTMIIDISDNWGILLYNQTKNIDVVKSVYNQQYPNIYFEVVSSDQDIFTDTLIVNYQLMNSTNSFLNSSICVYSSGEENVIQTSTIEIQNENGITQ